ncbi:hypothetical protein CVT25_003059 [Psilocybe cyanescens]|uniref:Uncharacterized protein n=1 Tax=Psilocybe cyanescens TaxID=93625 RepID=A0A409XK77_PSICY|nr:hypothetical protein CVT25_003059 [Psilocybe cyanescens]
MSSLFSVSKLLGKSRAKSNKRALPEPTRSSSLMSSSTAEKEKDVTPKSSTVILPNQPTATSGAPKIVPNTDLESVSEKQPSASPPAISEPIEIIPETNLHPERVSVEEPGYAIVPQKEAMNFVEEPGYDLVFQPKAKSSETEWSELDATNDDRDTKDHTADIMPVEANIAGHIEPQIPQQDDATRRSLDKAGSVHQSISTSAERLDEVQVQDTPQTAHDELQARSRTIEDLLAQTERMGANISRLEREKEVVAEATKREKDELIEEISRLKGIIGVERLDNREQLANFEREKAELHAQLVAQEENIIQLEIRLAEEHERIGTQEIQLIRLEERVAEGQEEAEAVYTRSRELEARFQRYQEDIAEERSRVEEKESHIRMVEKNNENLAAQLVHLQSNLNEAERQNRMFIDQLRRQSNELQASKSGTGGSNVTRLGPLILGRALANGPTRIESAISTIKMLNEEIFQTAAAMTDQLEGIPKRFVVEDDGTSAKAEILKSMLGLELVRNLQEEAQYPPEEYNPLFVQIALQGCLTASCMRIITSWYPAEWEYGNFLVALYERIRGTGGPEIALNWKKATQQSCIPSTDRNAKLVTYLTEQVQAVLTVCGWSQQSAVEEILSDKYSRNLIGIVSQAIRLNTLTVAGEGRDVEAILVEAGRMFDPKQMQNDNPFDSAARKVNVTSSPDEEVVCTTALGLKMEQGSAGESNQILLMPKVFLNGATCYGAWKCAALWKDVQKWRMDERETHRRQEEELALLQDTLRQRDAKVQETKIAVLSNLEEIERLRKRVDDIGRDLEGAKQQNRTLVDRTKTLSARNQLLEAELNRVKGENLQVVELLRIRTAELKGTHAFLTKADQLSGADVIKLVEGLNAEIMQTAAVLAEELEIEAKEDLRGEVDIAANELKKKVEVEEDAAKLESDDMKEAFMRTEEIVGPRMAELLKTSEHHEDPILIQIALQASMAAYTHWIVSSWCFESPEDEHMLSEIYARVRESEEQAVSGRWRQLTRTHLQRMLTQGPDLTSEMADAFASIFITAGYKKSLLTVHESIMNRFSKHISTVMKLAQHLNKQIGEGVTSCDLEALYIAPDVAYNAITMEDAIGVTSVKKMENGYGHETILCTTDLGLVRAEKISGTTGDWHESVLLRPKVVLFSGIASINGNAE